ncbi:MAG: 50S ribosomal protein L21 [Bdellovibrionota bacterium]
MYAVIRTGSKQYRVEPGVELLVEKLDGIKPGDSYNIEDVLLFSDGKEVAVGTPLVPASVHCKCVQHEKGPKLRGVKYRRRKNYRRTLGHRQQYTRLLVEKLEKRG